MSESVDPFELFDRASGADTCRTPYPEFAVQRAEGPVVKVNASAMMGGGDPENLPEIYAAVSYEAVSQVLRDGKTFSSGAYKDSMGVVMGPTILVMDEPEHGRYRSLIQMAFSKKSLAHWENDLVRPIVNGLIDKFADRGSADLVRELTFPFPVHVIAGMLGLPDEDLPQFHRWAVELISVAFNWEQGIKSAGMLGEYLTPIIEARRENPGNDLISVLTAGELDGNRLDNDHVLGFLRLLLPAGAETTYRSSSNLLYGLLSNPEQLEALREERSLMEQAIEEGLRWEVPLTGIGRQCTVDTVVEGVPIPAGASVQVLIGSANHDESRYDEPEKFDIYRPARQHMSFAFGPHRCLGMHLARMETDVVVGALLDRLPGLRLDPSAEDVHITGRGFRAPRRLPVLFG
ncbi:cytochrome P450 [Myxococcota bacterium]|nr:cytochrome P450 [Myxococcota bacterium]